MQRKIDQSTLMVPCIRFARTRTSNSVANAKASTQVVTHLPVGWICNQVIQGGQTILSRRARRSDAQVRSGRECRYLNVY